MRGLRADGGGGGGTSSSSSTAENSRFDAAQYSFFGKAPLDGLELGGLVDDGGVECYGGGFGGHDDGAYQLSPVGEEVQCIEASGAVWESTIACLLSQKEKEGERVADQHRQRPPGACSSP